MTTSIRGDKKRRRGRPKTGVGVPIGLRWQPDELQEIDNWRRDEPDLPTRPDAIRRLVKLGLTVKRGNAK